MKTIKKDELFQSLSDFLKSKGVELKDGAYSQRINRACDVLANTINTTQKAVRRTKVKVDAKLDQLRQSIHEATAPEPAPDSPPTGDESPGKKPAKAKRKKRAAYGKARPSK